MGVSGLKRVVITGLGPVTPIGVGAQAFAQAQRAGVQVAVTSGRELPLLAQALAERAAALLPDEPTLDGWAARRETALTQPEAQRTASLNALRRDIRRAVGLA